jgi:hypothetical protein
MAMAEIKAVTPQSDPHGSHDPARHAEAGAPEASHP